MTVLPGFGRLANSILGTALLAHELRAVTQIPPPPLQQVLTIQSWLAPQSLSTLQAGDEHDVDPETHSPLPPLVAPQMQPGPQ